MQLVCGIAECCAELGNCCVKALADFHGILCEIDCRTRDSGDCLAGHADQRAERITRGTCSCDKRRFQCFTECACLPVGFLLGCTEGFHGLVKAVGSISGIGEALLIGMQIAGQCRDLCRKPLRIFGFFPLCGNSFRILFFQFGKCFFLCPDGFSQWLCVRTEVID